MRNNEQQKTTMNNGGTGFIGLLTILFIGLKLTGHISWSWWWVLAPIWGTFAVIITFVVFAVLIAFATSK